MHAGLFNEIVLGYLVDRFNIVRIMWNNDVIQLNTTVLLLLVPHNVVAFGFNHMQDEYLWGLLGSTQKAYSENHAVAKGTQIDTHYNFKLLSLKRNN